MIYDCNFCGKRAKTNIYFRVAKEDLVGFLLLCVALVAPVGFIAFIITLIQDLGKPPALGSLIFAVVFLLSFYRVGRKVYGFFSLFVDYELKLDFVCQPCGTVLKVIALPKKEKNK